MQSLTARLLSYLTLSLFARVGLAAAAGVGAIVVVSDTLGDKLLGDQFPEGQINVREAYIPSASDKISVAAGSLVDPQGIELVPADGSAFDLVGFSVDVEGDVLIAGSPGYDNDRGTAYIFQKQDDGWIFKQQLLAPDGAADDHFGWDVAISGNSVAIGAYDINRNDLGAVYVYIQEAGTWAFQQKLTTGIAGDDLGGSVNLSGDTLVAGASGDGLSAGAAYIFVRSGGTWTQQQKLAASDAAQSSDFGWSVGISGNTAIIGAPRSQGLKGAAYIFERTENTWSQTHKASPDDLPIGAGFGHSVAIDGDTAIAGAVLDDGAAEHSGSASIYVKSAGQWSFEQRLVNTNDESKSKFGTDVDIKGNIAIIGANGQDIPTLPDGGAAHLYERDGGVWTLRQVLISPSGQPGENFGGDVAVGVSAAVVGSYLRDITTGQAEYRDLGSVYAFLLSPALGSTVEVSGRVLTAEGNALRAAKVTITDLATGAGTSVLTSSLGYFSFQQVAAGRDYRVTVASKRYRFNPQTFTLMQAKDDLEFLGSE